MFFGHGATWPRGVQWTLGVKFPCDHGSRPIPSPPAGLRPGLSAAKTDGAPPRPSSLKPGCKPGTYCLATGNGFGLSESELR
jgi:hypothetical protein